MVSLHWGVEYQSDPTSAQVALAQGLLGSGAIDLIVGHHAHVVQPIGRVGERHVVYGLGNLVSNQCCLETQDGVIVELEMAKRAEGWWDARHTAFYPDEGGAQRVRGAADHGNARVGVVRLAARRIGSLP